MIKDIREFEVEYNGEYYLIVANIEKTHSDAPNEKLQYSASIQHVFEIDNSGNIQKIDNRLIGFNTMEHFETMINDLINDY